jgi:hypothetical protein
VRVDVVEERSRGKSGAVMAGSLELDLSPSEHGVRVAHSLHKDGDKTFAVFVA